MQPGFGRLGRSDPSGSLWGFARHGLEPDLVSLGKPMGNGHPIAGVVARRELVDAFAARGRYFNTFGGNGVSIAAAQATLDVVRDEGLPEHAAAVGGRLLEALRALDDPRIGAVRGAGLFIGVDLVDATGGPDEAARPRRGQRAARAAHPACGIRARQPHPQDPAALVFDDADASRLVTELAAVLKEHCMSNLEKDPGELLVAEPAPDEDVEPAQRRAARPARGSARRTARDDRAPHAARRRSGAWSAPGASSTATGPTR